MSELLVSLFEILFGFCIRFTVEIEAGVVR